MHSIILQHRKKDYFFAPYFFFLVGAFPPLAAPFLAALAFPLGAAAFRPTPAPARPPVPAAPPRPAFFPAPASGGGGGDAAATPPPLPPLPATSGSVW